MKKLTLQLDDLRVESFETVAEAEVRGTVHGRDDNTAGSVPSCCRTCDGDPTCFTGLCQC
jgi:hypothetical protein